MTKTWFQEINDYLDKKRAPLGWLIFAGIVVLGTASIGTLLANSIVQPAQSVPYEKDFLYFDFTYDVQNHNNKRYNVMRETEILQFNYTVFNKHNEQTTFSITEKVMNSGQETYHKELNTPIVPPNTFYNVSRYIPVEKAGMNQVQLEIEIREYGEKTTGGIPEIKNPILENKIIGYDQRTYTQAEYDYKLERHSLYKWLFVAGAPFILLAVKAIRDIWYDQ